MQEDLQGEKVIGMLKIAKRRSMLLQSNPQAAAASAAAAAAASLPDCVSAPMPGTSPRAEAGHRRQPSSSATASAPELSAPATTGHRRTPSNSTAALTEPAAHVDTQMTHRRQSSTGGTATAAGGGGHRRQPSADVPFETFNREWGMQGVLD